MNIDKKISSTLMVANLIATVFVISIHYNTKGSAQGLNYIAQEFITNGVARVAVPFFALISGYFAAMALRNKTYMEILAAKFRTLLIPFFVGSFIILLVPIGKKLFYEHSVNLGFSIKWLIRAFMHPDAIQYWFLRDLIVLTIISPLLVFDGWRRQVSIAMVIGFLWFVDFQPFPIIAGWYFINIETLLFFVIGGLLIKADFIFNFLVNSSKKKIFVFLFFWISLLVVRIYIDPKLDVWYVRDYTVPSVLLYKLAILVGMCSLIQLSAFMCLNMQVIYLSGLTFFAYLYHLTPLLYFTGFTRRIISEEYQFYINFPVALAAVFALAHFLSKFHPLVFTFITGGRSPNKALERIQ